MLVKRATIIAFSIQLAALFSVSAAQTPTTTITLGPDQVGLVKTAERITTRISFPETIKEIICGDLYDPATGRGSFVVQGSDMDVFLKPIVSKGVSNIFVKTGKKGEFIYSLDLVIGPVDEAYRIVTVTNPQASLQSARPAAEAAMTSTKIPPLLPGIAAEVAPDEGAGNLPLNLLISVSERSEPNEPPAPIPVRKRVVDDILHRDAGNVSHQGEAIRRVAATYPEYARSVGASGAVTVAVKIDKEGKVKSARAVSGHMFLREAAVIAALAWRFSPTIINGVQAEATGEILFSFDRSGRTAEGSVTPIVSPPSKRLQDTRRP
jgi:TonB family protein